MAFGDDQVDERPTLPPLRELFPECFPADRARPNITVDARREPERAYTYRPSSMQTTSPGRRVQRRATLPLADVPAPVASGSQHPLHHPGNSFNTGCYMSEPPLPETIRGRPLSGLPLGTTQTRRSEHTTGSNENHAVTDLPSGVSSVENATVHTPSGTRTATSLACDAVATHIPSLLNTTRHRRVPPSTGPLVDHDGPINAGPPTPPWLERAPISSRHSPPWSELTDLESQSTIHHEPRPSLSPAAPDCMEPPSVGPRPRALPLSSTAGAPPLNMRAVRGPTRAEPSIAGPSTRRSDRLSGVPPAAAVEAGPSTRPVDAPGPSGSTSSVHRAARLKRYACSLCAKSFSRPSALKTHMVSHTNTKDYACPVPGCGRRYTIKSNLTRHLRAHDPPFDPPAPAHRATGSGAGPYSRHETRRAATFDEAPMEGTLQQDLMQEDSPPEDSADDSTARDSTPSLERRNRRRKGSPQDEGRP